MQQGSETQGVADVLPARAPGVGEVAQRPGQPQDPAETPSRQLAGVQRPLGIAGHAAGQRPAPAQLDRRHLAVDAPRGAQQPFGGARSSGTNDKAGSASNLLRWASPRTVKETLVPPLVVPYPHQAAEG